MSTTAPTLAQQNGLAYACKPFAIISFLSSSYIIYYLLHKERKRLSRIYQRLVLSMNIALLPLSTSYILGSWAIPYDTPNYVSASGTIATCTAQGFISIMFAMVVPTYYGSLVLQAFMGMKNNYNEMKYRWIEKYIHLVAWVYPCIVTLVPALTENINPGGFGCWYGKAPRGCESDPSIPCERGDDIGMYVLLVGLTQVFLYFIFPPAVVIAMYCWIRRVHNKMIKSRGIQKVMETARKKMMMNITKQISLYLLAFWFTFVLGLIHNAYQIISGGGMLYNLLIVANCVYSLQGFVFMIVYFTLEKLGTKKVEECLPYDISDRENSTVNEIRTNVQRKIQHSSRRLFSRRDTVVYKSYVNVFDGAQRAENSTWAQFQSYYDDERRDQSDGVANDNVWYNDEEGMGLSMDEQEEKDGDTTDISVDYPRRRSSLGSILSVVELNNPLPLRRRSM